MISVFNIFNIGIGPSSSHTVGPMRASVYLLEKLKKHDAIDSVDRITCELYGSLSATGIGHATDLAIYLGLEGIKPEKADPDHLQKRYEKIKRAGKLHLNGDREIEIKLVFKDFSLPLHSNGMKYICFSNGKKIYKKIFYSIGGGFIVGNKTAKNDDLSFPDVTPKYIFNSATDLLDLCRKENKVIWEIFLSNELAIRTSERIDEKIVELDQVMSDCIERGLKQDGHLPGKLQVKRRAKQIYDTLCSTPEKSLKDPLTIIDWVNLYALAVNEENAAGGKVVTAPTNGAAGIIPAVLAYYKNFCEGANFDGIKRFLLTAGGVGVLYKRNASISGAEVGCQGEVGVACSMAAAALTEAMGGTPMQVENAAEIGMEHNLGLICDPINGQVQIPCIERNAMAAVKAINASRIALKGEGHHYVSLDKVMKTMKETGRDMQEKYKETSKGGLAVNITEC